MATDPWQHILIDLDHEEEQDAVDEDHTEDNRQVNPLGPIHIDLENVLQDEVTRDSGLIRVLVVKYEAFHVILALALYDV